MTPRAVDNLRALSVGLGLPQNALRRVQRSLRMLERFPLAGRALTGRWEGTRFIVGPWPWVVVVYVYDEADDAVFVVAIQDGRSASSAAAHR